MIDSLTHHGYGIAGQAGDIVPKILLCLEKDVGYRTKGNPDFRFEQYDVMGIDEARDLKEAADRKAVANDKKVFIISARSITKEAQNALLKVFEEPPADTHFFLVVPSLEILLPTLRSRIHLGMSFSKAENEEPTGLASNFLAGSTPERLKTIQGLLKNAEEAFGKQTLIDFLDELERCLAGKEHILRAQALEEVFNMKKYSRDRAPSFKLLLEHLALVLPQVM